MLFGTPGDGNSTFFQFSHGPGTLKTPSVDQRFFTIFKKSKKRSTTSYFFWHFLKMMKKRWSTEGVLEGPGSMEIEKNMGFSCIRDPQNPFCRQTFLAFFGQRGDASSTFFNICMAPGPSKPLLGVTVSSLFRKRSRLGRQNLKMMLKRQSTEGILDNVFSFFSVLMNPGPQKPLLGVTVSSSFQ